MMLQTGIVVKSIAGHDKNTFYCVVGMEKDAVFIADGKSRKLENPKRKNVKHLAPTTTILNPAAFATDKKLRQALKAFAEKPQEEGGYSNCPSQTSSK